MEHYREIIRSKRERAGLSQFKLAKMVGITQSFMNEIESGKKKSLYRGVLSYLPGPGDSSFSRREVTL